MGEGRRNVKEIVKGGRIKRKQLNRNSYSTAFVFSDHPVQRGPWKWRGEPWKWRGEPLGMLGLLLFFVIELTRQDTQGRGMHGSNMVVVAKKVFFLVSNDVKWCEQSKKVGSNAFTMLTF